MMTTEQERLVTLQCVANISRLLEPARKVAVSGERNKEWALRVGRFKRMRSRAEAFYEQLVLAQPAG